MEDSPCERSAALEIEKSGSSMAEEAQRGRPKPFDFVRKRSIAAHVDRGGLDLPLPLTGSNGRARGGSSSDRAAPNRRPPMTNTNSSKRPRRMAREPKTETAVAPSVPEASAVSPEPEVQPAQPKKPSKTETVLTLLRRAEGTTLDELVSATGWLPHTTRAAMTGLKKKGHQITRTKVDGVSRYTVGEAAPQ